MWHMCSQRLLASRSSAMLCHAVLCCGVGCSLLNCQTTFPLGRMLCAVLCCDGCRRLEYRPHNISWADVEAEAKTGKTFVSPYPDREGRPVVIMRPRWVGGVKKLPTQGKCAMLACDNTLTTLKLPHLACPQSIVCKSTQPDRRSLQ
jgi:hypothetical protein